MPIRHICQQKSFSRAFQLGLEQGTLINLAYRIRENEHPEYGGLEAEIAGIELA
jgi:single-stranded-DNA-specific exonuclease